MVNLHKYLGYIFFLINLISLNFYTVAQRTAFPVITSVAIFLNARVEIKRQMREQIALKTPVLIVIEIYNCDECEKKYKSVTINAILSW